MINRRSFLGQVAGGVTGGGLANQSNRLVSFQGKSLAAEELPVDRWNQEQPRQGEGLFEFVRRVRGRIDLALCGRILGAANEFKEGDELLGVAAVDQAMRKDARHLLANTRCRDIDRYPIHKDPVLHFITETVRHEDASHTEGFLTLKDLKRFLLTASGEQIKQVSPSLSSDVIGCVVKLMNNQELISVATKVFNPLPGSRIGDQGYLGARVQPNSPTDNEDDIFWQVLDAWSYGVGDVLLGTNPVSSETDSVTKVERVLQDLLSTFDLDDVMPHCVLAHIDVQAEVEQLAPGSTALWFQSIAGTEAANRTFDISVDKMKRYADTRSGTYGLYFETGQGADFTNGHGAGFDMVLHESRKYGFARGLKQRVDAARRQAGISGEAWVHLNDVAGFIGPEVFRTREQLVRCCLEDILMGKLHGLCIGLDVCSTLHMDISLEDLDWCLDQVMPANPAYLMALPTKIDPMLGYLTTGYQDHVRLRQAHGLKVNDPIWKFFQTLGVIGPDDSPTEKFGDPLVVYVHYRRRKGDLRTEDEIRKEGKAKIQEVRGRGVFIAEGSGERPWDLSPELKSDIDRIFSGAKKSIWSEFSPQFVDRFPNGLSITTQSNDREDYILHPSTGEQLSDDSRHYLASLRSRDEEQPEVQIVISDGLNALSIMEQGQLLPFLEQLHRKLDEQSLIVSRDHLVVTMGRVRAGYRIGETLFAGLTGRRTILHVIGERPGTGHQTFSTYITAVDSTLWTTPGKVDHNHTKVVSGIATTALDPIIGANATASLLKDALSQPRS